MSEKNTDGKICKEDYCKRHDVEINIYCEDCKEWVCVLCLIEAHTSHTIVQTIAGSANKKDLEASRLFALDCREKLNKAQNDLEASMINLDKNQRETNEKITSHFQDVRGEISKEEEKVKDSVARITALQKNRMKTEIVSIQHKQRLLEEMVPRYDNMSQKASREFSMKPPKMICFPKEARDKILQVDLAWDRPTFVPERDPKNTCSDFTFGRVSLDLQGNIPADFISDDGSLNFDDGLEEQLFTVAKS